MKNFLKNYLAFIVLYSILFSCRPYRYFQPSPNTALFKKQGELHIAGDLGISGSNLKAAYALPGNIGISGSLIRNFVNYRTKEGEIGLGYYSNADPFGVFVIGGVGFGSNFSYTDSTKTAKSFEGDFVKPYIQFNFGATGGTIFKGLKGDLIGLLKASYLIYDGKKLQNKGGQIKSRYTLIEPGFDLALGSKAFKFNLIFSFPLHPTFEGLKAETNARTYPFTTSFGIKYIFGRSI